MTSAAITNEQINKTMKSISPMHLVSDANTTWSVYMLIRYVVTYNPRAVKIPVAEFRWFLNHKIWLDDNGALISINDVLNRRVLPTKHIKSITVADISFPILVDHNWIILDGAHRLAKAVKNSAKYIHVQIIDSHIMRKCALGRGYRTKPIREYEREKILSRGKLDKLFMDRLGTIDLLRHTTSATSELIDPRSSDTSGGGANFDDNDDRVFIYDPDFDLVKAK
jgi:hypothetical protein